MSLISRMLQDLEQRQSLAAGDPVLAGLSSVDYCAREEQRSHAGRRQFGFVVIPATLAVLAYLVLIPDPAVERRALPQAPVSAPEIGSVAAASDAAPAESLSVLAHPSLRMDETLSFLARAAVTAPEPVVPPPSSTKIAADNDVLISAVDVTPRDGFVDVAVSLSDGARFAAYPLTAPDRLVLEITGARVGEGVARNFDSGPVRRLRARVERGVAMLVFDLQGAARLESAALAEGEQPSLHLTLAMSGTTGSDAAMAAAPAAEVVTPGIPGDMKIQPARTRRGAGGLFDTASKQIATGDVATGLATLSEVLAQDPAHVEGRRLLATVLLQQGDRDQAASILDAGLQKHPRTWQWAQLRAQVAIAAGDHEGALQVLAAAPPPLAEQRDYHALLAAMQQRTGRHAEAVTTYHAILGHEPGRGVWWMGLGISLQALQRTREAGFAFTRALEDSSLTGDLRSFIQARKAALPEGDNA